MKNEHAAELGRLSAKARLKGKNKKQRSEAMKPVWEASRQKRKERSLLTKAESPSGI